MRYGAVSLTTIAASVVWVFGSTVLLRTDGRTTLLLVCTALVTFFSAMIGVAWLLRNLRPDEVALEEYKHESEHDPLTGLPNIKALDPILEELIKSTKRSKSTLGVLFIDVDRLKYIHDSMGHKAGVDLLVQVAERIKLSLRSADVATRFTGYKFVVLCPDLLNERSVVDVARQILKSFERLFEVQGTSQRMSANIGLTTLDSTDERTGQELLRDADLAMFTARIENSRYALFNEQHRLDVLERQELEQDLNQAVEEGQFHVVYQPLVNLDDGTLYAFEALVRWNHPTKGQIMPGVFLSVAEEVGLIGEIGTFVMREACAQAAVWNHLSPEASKIRMSVNLAEQQLLDQKLAERVAETLTWAGLEAEQLVLEITENIIVEHLDGLDPLRELRNLGVSLAVDDFGTGQSSLSYLKQFDMVSTLKIDQSFVRDLEVGNADQAIVEAVISMSEALGLRVVVEGVETESQMRLLKEMGVDVMQGYLFSSPIKPPEGDPAEWFSMTIAGNGSKEAMSALDVSHRFLAHSRR